MNLGISQTGNLTGQTSAEHPVSSHGTYLSDQQWSSGHTSDYPRQPQQYSAVLTVPSHTYTTSPSVMSGQYPAHHHGRLPLGSPQHGQTHGLPAWSHSPVTQSQGMGMHPAAGMGMPSQGPGYYPPPHPAMLGVTARGLQGQPQHAHTGPPASERQSPHHHPGVGVWNNLGLPPKSLGSHEPNRGPSSRSQVNSSAGGNPLFSLQMLVNPDINRNAVAAAQASYATVSPLSLQQESVDLSSASSEIYSRISQQMGPIPLTRAEKQVEPTSMRNGNIKIPPSTIASPLSLNGEVSPDSGIDGSAVQTPSSFQTFHKDSYAKTKRMVEPVPTTEIVSVIAQAPLRERVVQSHPPQSKIQPENTFIESKQDIKRDKDLDTEDDDGIKPLIIDIDYNKSGKEDDQDEQELTIKEEDKEHYTIKSEPSEDTSSQNWTIATTSASITTIQSSPKKSSDEVLSSAVPSVKDFSSPVRSPKSGNLKRTMKVDSLLENLVENGVRRTSSLNDGSEQATVQSSTIPVIPASVIVSPPSCEDLTTGDSDHCSSSESSRQRAKSPLSVKEEDDYSPSSGNGDDTDSSKPRRKRKPEKPIRVASSSDSDVQKTKEEFLQEGTSDSAGSNEVIIEKEEKTVKSGPSVILIDDSSDSKSVSSEKVIDETSEEHLTEKLAKTFPSLIVDEAVLKSGRDQRNSSDILSHSDLENSIKSPNSKSDVKNPFIEVESELEKMFAGIVENEDSSQDPLKLDSPSIGVNERDSYESKNVESFNDGSEGKLPSSSLKRGRPRGKKGGTRRSSESVFCGSSTSEITPKKKKKKKKQMKTAVNESTTYSNFKSKRARLFQGSGKDSSLVCDSNFKFRGPIIHIEGPKDSPSRVNIINAPSRLEDEDGADRGSNKKLISSSGRRKNYRNDLEYGGKATRSRITGLGMFSSTLSTRYDAHTPDQTWICVFCKHGPHAGGRASLGDLFGPYIIGKEKTAIFGQIKYCDIPLDDKDITEEQKKGGRNKRSIRQADLVDQFRHKMSKKAKRTQSIESAQVFGMILVPPDKSDPSTKEDSFEVWVHEDCIAWTDGVHMVGSKIVGLQEAVWSAMKNICGRCSATGATVGCIQRGCDMCMHVKCAREHGWTLDESTYVARCHRHTRESSPELTILPT